MTRPSRLHFRSSVVSARDTVAEDDGDLTPGNNQIPIAMGKGARAGLAIDKELRTYPKSLEELSADAEGDVAPAADD